MKKRYYQLEVQMYPGSWHPSWFFNARSKNHANDLVHDFARHHGRLPCDYRCVEIRLVDEYVLANTHNENMG